MHLSSVRERRLVEIGDAAWSPIKRDFAELIEDRRGRSKHLDPLKPQGKLLRRAKRRSRDRIVELRRADDEEL